ncbi:hypothetical protein Bbelb_224530 [Branchiostoma belcheri]|nr:hypothetical protein Bbelb_224530 [Branchiostoma belcheri]
MANGHWPMDNGLAGSWLVQGGFHSSIWDCVEMGDGYAQASALAALKHCPTVPAMWQALLQDSGLTQDSVLDMLVRIVGADVETVVRTAAIGCFSFWVQTNNRNKNNKISNRNNNKIVSNTNMSNNNISNNMSNMSNTSNKNITNNKSNNTSMNMSNNMSNNNISNNTNMNMSNNNISNNMSNMSNNSNKNNTSNKNNNTSMNMSNNMSNNNISNNTSMNMSNNNISNNMSNMSNNSNKNNTSNKNNKISNKISNNSKISNNNMSDNDMSNKNNTNDITNNDITNNDSTLSNPLSPIDDRSPGVKQLPLAAEPTNQHASRVLQILQAVSKDLDWEVKLAALRFWEHVIAHYLPGFSAGAVSTGQSPNHSSRGQDGGSDVQSSCMEAGDTNWSHAVENLSSHGCLQLLVEAADDYDRPVSEKACRMLKELKAMMTSQDQSVKETDFEAILQMKTGGDSFKSLLEDILSGARRREANQKDCYDD